MLYSPHIHTLDWKQKFNHIFILMQLLSRASPFALWSYEMPSAKKKNIFFWSACACCVRAHRENKHDIIIFFLFVAVSSSFPFRREIYRHNMIVNKVGKRFADAAGDHLCVRCVMNAPIWWILPVCVFSRSVDFPCILFATNC